MLGKAGAIAKIPPQLNGSLDDGQANRNQVQAKTAIGAASSAAVETLPQGMPLGGAWVTFTTDTDCYIAFGPDAGMVAASASNAWPLAANSVTEWRCNEKSAWFRVIRKSADGTLARYKSEQ